MAGTGIRIRAAREKLGLNQADLAKAIGKPPSFVSRLETDESSRIIEPELWCFRFHRGIITLPQARSSLIPPSTFTRSYQNTHFSKKTTCTLASACTRAYTHSHDTQNARPNAGIGIPRLGQVCRLRVPPSLRPCVLRNQPRRRGACGAGR